MRRSLYDTWWRLATGDHPRSFWGTLACGALSVGARAYRAAVAIRNAAYDRRWITPVRLPCTVVSVGNLTVGGTGKTTCVELMARALLSRGRTIAVLSRGYGAPRRGPYWLRWDGHRLDVNGPSGAVRGELPDEPQLLARHLEGVPIVIGVRRDRTGRLAHERFGADVVLLDDGFQHRQVARDCEVVLVHARMPLSGWAMLPRGPMREPMRSLARAQVVIITKADEAWERLGAFTERLRSLAPEAAIVTAMHQPTALLAPSDGAREDPHRLSGMRVGLLSSIGDPAGFEATVQRLHATVAWHRAFPDHHPYQAADWEAVIRQARQGGVEMLVTTEKDWVRLERIATGAACPIPVRILQVQMQVVDGAEALDDRLARVCAG